MMPRRTLSLALATLIALAPLAQAYASQNTLQMPTSGTVSGLQFSNKVTDALDSLVTCNSGPSAPTNAAGGAAKLGQCWLDTTSATSVIKYVYTGSAWIRVGTIDVTNGIWVPPIGGGGPTNIASASTVSLCSVPASYINITGSTSVIAFGTGCPAGQMKVVRFSGVFGLYHDATSMVLPGGSSGSFIQTAAGDVALAVHEGSGNWRVVSYNPASGQAVANPALYVGAITFGVNVTEPAKYAFGYGQAALRASYPEYLAAVTSTQSVTRTSGSPTLTGFSSIAGFGAGMPVEGTGIPAATTILSCATTTCTLSANATTSGTSNVTVFTTGYGSGGDTTTVGVFDCSGVMLAGRSNMSGTDNTKITTAGSGIDGKALGAAGGAQNVTISQANLPAATLSTAVTDTRSIKAYGTANFTNATAINFSGSTGIVYDGANLTQTVAMSIANGSFSLESGSISASTALGGSGTATNKMPPTRIANCFVRMQP